MSDENILQVISPIICSTPMQIQVLLALLTLKSIYPYYSISVNNDRFLLFIDNFSVDIFLIL